MIADNPSNEWQRGILPAAFGGAASLVLALSMAASPLMGVAVTAGALAVCLGLFAPAGLILTWFASGPTLSTWLDVDLGPLPAMTPDRALLAVLLGVIGWRWIRRPYTLLPLGRLEFLMAWFIIFAAGSALAGGGSRQTNLAVRVISDGSLRLDFVFLFLTYGLPFLGFFLMKNVLHRDRHIRLLLTTLIAVGVFVAFTGILQYYTPITLFTPTRMDVIHHERATGTMTSAPEFGLVVGIPFLAAVLCFFRSRFVPERLLLAGAIAFMGVAIVVAKTRVIWLGIVVGLAIAAFYERRLRAPLLAAALAATVAIGAAVPFMDSEFVEGRVMDMTPVYTRIATTATALNMFIHSPLVGYGFGRYTYDSEKWDYIVGVGGLSARFAYATGVPHNEYMHVLVLLGLAGFIPYIAILVIAWRTAARHYQAGPAEQATARRDLGLIVLSVLGLYLTSAFTVDAFAFGHASLQVYCLLGALDGLRART